MAFASSYHWHCWSALAEGATWEVLEEEGTSTEAGWDTLKLLCLSRQASGSRAICASQIPMGYRIGSENFWVQNAAFKPVGGDLWQAELTCLGMQAAKGEKYHYTSAITEVTADDVTIDAILYPRATVAEAAVVCEVERLIIGGVPATTDVGKQSPSLPGSLPSVRSSVWSSIPDPLYHYPNGWVLVGCEADQLRNVPLVWLERRAFQYVYPLTP